MPDAPKKDDRLKKEDKKNQEKTVEAKTEKVVQPIPEVKAEAKQPEIPVEQKAEVIEQVEQPSKVVETEVIPITAPAELKEDMKIIDELE